MNTLYNYQEQHDAVLAAVEQSLITDSLPGRRTIYVISQNDDDVDLLSDMHVHGA